MKFDPTAIATEAFDWENRKLGSNEEFVVVAEVQHEMDLEELLELQAISIRLPVELVRKYKLIASYHNVGYQPLMRDILHRQVRGLLKEISDAEEAKPLKDPLWPPLKKAA